MSNKECGKRWCLNLPTMLHLAELDGHEVVLYYCSAHSCTKCQVYLS
jgi:hypothetical protein